MKYFSVILAGVLVCVSGVLSAEYKNSLNRDVQDEVDTPQVNTANEKGKEDTSEGKYALEYLDDIEDESEKYIEGRQGFSNTKAAIGKRSLTSKASCNVIWMHSSNQYKYSSYIPSVSVKTRLYVDTDTYLGGSSNPNLCGKPKYYSDKLRHSGVSTSTDGCLSCPSYVMARVNNYQANNASWIHSYRKQWSYGTAVHKPTCAHTKHYSTNNGSTFSKTLKTGTC